MNLNDGDEDPLFNQHCLELAKLLRTEQTEHFLHLYDSLPSEWNGSREYLQLETAKEYIRQLQELDENEFELTYQRAFQNGKNEQQHQTIIMSNLPIQSAVIRNNNDNDGEQTLTANNRITSVSVIQQKQHNERITANNLACDEKHDLSSKHSSSIKRNNDEFNTKTRRLQPITNNNKHDITQNNCRTRTPVDSFVQLNLKPSIDIKLEDYKKAKDTMSAIQNSSTNSRSPLPRSIDTNETNEQSIIQSNIIKKPKSSTKNKSHEEASFDYFSKNDEDNKEHSRSSSSSSTTNNNNKNDLSINQTLSQSNSFEHSKLIANNDFDSHGSSIATKSSSENSGSARTASGSDSDDEHHRHQSDKQTFLSTIKSSLYSKDKFLNHDDTPTIVLNKTSENRPSQHDRISILPEQMSYELVKLNTNDEHPLHGQVGRFKQPVTDDPNGINNSNNDILSYTAQRSQPNNLSSSSHQNRNSERHEPYNTNHSNPSRKTSTRPTKKRKQLQQQEVIRTELIPGHRGDLDVDELVMFIDGNSSTKQQQRQTSVPLRPTDTNSNNNNNPTSRRKSRKPIKILQESINNNNENKTLQIDEDTQSIGFIDEDDDTTTTHSLNNTYNEPISLPNDDGDDDESHSNITNGEILLPEWHNTSPSNDDIDSFSLSSTTTLNNSNSEIISEPFVTVTHRRRSIKERRQDNNNNISLTSSTRITNFPSSSNINDKRRFQSGISTQNGITRPTIQNSLSNIKPFVSTTTKEEDTNITSSPPPPPLPPVSQASVLPSISVSNNLPEQSSPRLSSHSSSSSLSSLLKRQSKAPPVVFLNKSIDIELNDVSFGFDMENPILDKPPTPPPPPPLPVENEPNLSSNDLLTNSKPSSSRRSYQQRNTRGPLFYSGSDIRPHHHQHRNYPSQTPVSQSSYIDPLLLLQYNQQRYQQLAYMNLLRTQYLSSQSQYVLIPTTTYEPNQEEKNPNDETIPTSEQIQEPLLVYTTIPGQPGPIYYQPTKKSFQNFEQSSVYPSQYFYPTHPAYFQPISSLLVDNKSQQDDTDDNDGEEEEEVVDNDYEKSTRLFHQTRQQQSSSHIMSNALQLVYSQEKRNTQIDHFNLDQVTAYLAMKWTDTIDHYEQGDDEILLMGEQ